MLTFVGLGLDIKDLSIKAVEEIHKADKVFGEAYTIDISEQTRYELEHLIKREIIWLDRKDLEDLADQFIMKAKHTTIALLVGGDPFIATTHLALRIRAVELNIPCQVIHAPSIYSVVPSSTGLFSYKFGCSASIPFPEQGSLSETPYRVISRNQAIGAHTLVFLDLKPKQNRYMTIKEGLGILEELEQKRRENMIQPNTLVIGLARIGMESAVIRADKLKRIKELSFGSPPHAIVIPGPLHFAEAEALVKLWGAPTEIIN
ncbi:MAG: diphthine synthase [Candidatus Heimdallarchaeota archaeon]